MDCTNLVSCLFDRRAQLCNENNFHLTPIDFQINTANDDNISDLIGDIVTCGYTGIVSVDKRDSIIRYINIFGFHYGKGVLYNNL